MSPSRARLSVIVPSYNYAHFLPVCLDSVLGQGITELELIVVDDGSSDDTAAVVARYPTVRYLTQTNQGLSAARNTGLRHSSGDYLLFLDADDLLGRYSLAARLAFQHATGARLSVCRNRQFHTLDADRQPRAGARWYLPPGDLDLRLLNFNLAPPHAWLMHRQVCEDVGQFDTSLRACEDYDYWLRALACGHQPQYCPAGEVLYRKHGASMSADFDKQWRHDVILHGRVLDALLLTQAITPRAPACALLAAFAGAFTTLVRLAGSAHEDYRQLLARLTDSIDQLPARIEAGALPNTLLSDFYALTLLDACAAASQHDDAAEACAVRAVAALQARDALPQRSRAGSLLRLLSARNAPLVDRYRVARLLLRRQRA